MKRGLGRWEIVLVGAVFTAGLVLRLRLALLTYLNPDEAGLAMLSFGGLRQTLRNSFAIAHPPLLTWITYAVSRISRTEMAVRFVPVLAGCLFPVLLFVWLRRAAGHVAALTAFVLLTLAPQTITLSAELRQYMPALFLISAALLVFDFAIESGRWETMALYGVLLWLCILADYSAACFVGAAGVYALLRLKGSPTAIKITWLAGQLVALALYASLYMLQVRGIRATGVAAGATEGWLRQSFPQPGGMASFPFVNTPKPFAFLMSAARLGYLALIVFAGAIVLLWAGRTAIERSRARALAALLVLPFLLTIAEAYAHLFPYGGTRHNIELAIFAAAGIGVFLEALPRPIGLPILAGILLLSPLWVRLPGEDMAFERHQKKQILECLAYMRANIPPDALVFTDGATFDVLAYYSGHRRLVPWPGAGQYFSENALGGQWRIAQRDYLYATHAEYSVALAAFRRQYGLGNHDPVWVLDGGWLLVSGPPEKNLPFSKAVRVFQAKGD